MVVLVDKNDQSIGTMEKLEAHELGLLHRAFSVFIINDKKEILLQKRAISKYHSGGLWTNSCCSHPLPGEDVLDAGIRRTKEEIGIHLSKESIFKSGFLLYKSVYDNGLTEHEYDHILIAKTNNKPILNVDEAEAFEYVNYASIKERIASSPDSFTSWFKLIIEKDLLPQDIRQ
jgi:isopentenyl-diphosphate delta-isomerase